MKVIEIKKGVTEFISSEKEANLLESVAIKDRLLGLVAEAVIAIANGNLDPARLEELKALYEEYRIKKLLVI